MAVIVEVFALLFGGKNMSNRKRVILYKTFSRKGIALLHRSLLSNLYISIPN